MNEFIILLARTVSYTVEIVMWAITIDIILSWVYNGNNVFMRILHSITEPVLRPFRNLLRNSAIGGPGMRLDFSPILAMLFLQIGRNLIISFLYAML